MRTCFKKINGDDDVYFRSVQLEDGRWGIAERNDIHTELNQIFFDNNQTPHYLDEIANIGIGKNIDGKDVITTLDLFGTEQDEFGHYKKIHVTVTDDDEIKKIIDCLNQTKCNK